MILDIIESLPVDEVGLLEPDRVEGYVRRTGWRILPRLGRGRVAVYERPEDSLAQIRIPHMKGLADYQLLMAQTVAVIALWEKRPAMELLRELLLPTADLLRFRESGPTTRNGDIPLEHARELLAGVRRLLLAAAHSVLRPQRYHARLGLSDADEFVQACRLGQTERGSFTLTVACPLVNSEPFLFDQRPFGRRVTSLLMQSLDRLSRCDSLTERNALLHEAETEKEPNLSANFCEGVLDLWPADNEGTMEILADWSHTLPEDPSAPFPQSVRLRREVLPQIEYLAAKLRPADSLRWQCYIGPVETLDGWVNPANRRQGDVVIRVVDNEGEARRAHVDLNADEYALADEAHMNNRLVSVEGVLRRLGQRFRITDPQDFQIIHPRTRERPTS